MRNTLTIIALILSLALAAPAMAATTTVPATDEWNLPAGEMTVYIPDNATAVPATDEWNQPVMTRGAKGALVQAEAPAQLVGAAQPDEWHLGELR